MYSILQSSLSFCKDDAQAEHKLISLISAFAEVVPYVQDLPAIWRTIIICTSILFKFPCPYAGILLVDSVIAPLLKKVQFTKNYESCFNTSVRNVLIYNLEKPIEEFKFLRPSDVFDILYFIAEQTLANKVTRRRRKNPFRIHNIPLENTIMISYFYGVLFSKSDFLQSVYEHYLEELSNGLRNLYVSIYEHRLPELFTKSCETIDTIRSTVAKFFYHTTLINVNIVVDVLSLHPLTNLLHSMRSRCGGSAPALPLNIDALTELCSDICLYAQSCPISLLDTMKTKLILQLSSMPLTDDFSPVFPFLLDDTEPLYPDIVTKLNSEGVHKYVIHILVPPVHNANKQRNTFIYQGEQLYESIMGKYSYLMHSHPFPNITSIPQILFSPHSPEGAPLGLFTAAILGEARVFTS